MVKKLISLGIASALVLIGIFFLFFKHGDIQLFPQAEVNTDFYNDRIDAGNSKLLRTEVDKQSIRFAYSLDSGFLYPYCGVGVEPKDSKQWNLSDYNTLKIRLKASDLNTMFVYFHAFDEHVIDTLNRLSLRRLCNTIKLVPNTIQTVEVNFSDFETPIWWYNLIHQNRSDFEDPDYSKIRAIHFTSGLDNKMSLPVGFEIYDISVSNDYSLIFLFLVGSWLVITGIYAFILIKLKRKEKLKALENQGVQKIEVVYKPVEVDVSEEKSFIAFINSNFQDAELTLSSVAEEVGVSERVISTYISETYGCNFKTYVNNLRVNEAKRLLEDEDLNSGEVAYLVGFNSPANFNRVFKTLVGANPTEYIHKSQKAYSY